jgi:2-methylisocitrate lyase-like PEP mutase family enzyme
LTEHLSKKARQFHAMHKAEKLLVLPNAWDVASARLIEEAGYPALATTSAGIGYTFGVPDLHRMTREEMLAAVAPIIHMVNIPVTVDVENGYGDTPKEVGDTIRGLITVGAVGCNIEDISGDFDGSLEDINLVVERLHAGRQAADGEGIDLVINARTDGYLVGGNGLAVFSDTVTRANAYLSAGARSVFVPGLHNENEIAEMVREIDGPLNLLTVPGLPPLERLEELGVARVSTGSSMARAAYGSLKSGLRELAGAGTYSYTQYAISFDDMDNLFK